MAGPILALDIGNSTCKGLLAQADGTIGALVVVPNTGDPIADPRALWESLMEISGRLLALAPTPPVGIALCGRGGGLVCLDADGEPVSLPWRTVRMQARARPTFSPIYGRLASWASLFAAAREIAPGDAAGATRLCGIKDYLNFRLTGRWATDASSAGCTAWPRDLTPFGVRAEMLPPIHQGHEVLGTLRGEVELPLPKGTPVLVGGHDGVCANLGAGMVAVGDGCVTLGTNAVLRVNTDGPLLPASRFNSFTYPFQGNVWASGGDVLDAGATVVWAARLLGLFGEDPTNLAAALERFDNLAGEAPAGARGLICLPYLCGMVSPREDYRRLGAFVHIGPQHGRPEVARAVLEGIAFALRQIRDAFKQSGRESRALCLTGGGTRSRLWAAIVTSALGLPLAHVEAQASLKGAAILAAVGLDLHPTIDAAVGAMGRGKDPVYPDPAWAAVYDEAYGRYVREVEAA
jgi:sugar (pentulose or hexulose) kinase